MSVENVKVGDKVRCLVTECDVVSGGIYSVVLVDSDTDGYAVRVIDRVGDRYWLEHGEWEPITSLSANDTVRLKSGETFTTGSYTAEVDWVREDIVLLKHGSWVQLDAVEKVEHRFKVGDRVRYTGADPVVHDTLRIGATGRITNIGTPDAADVAWDDGINWPRGPLLSNLEIISPSPREPLVVTLSIDASSFSRDLADQFQRIADALRAA